jgi:hypothetical protein
MKEALLKTDLHEKIDHANSAQLKELYGLITNYFNGDEQAEDWDKLTQQQQQLINKGLEQADAGLGTPLADVTKMIREKHNLNG